MRGTMEDYYETSQYAYCCDKMAETASLQGVCIWVALGDTGIVSVSAWSNIWREFGIRSAARLSIELNIKVDDLAYNGFQFLYSVDKTHKHHYSSTAFEILIQRLKDISWIGGGENKI